MKKCLVALKADFGLDALSPGMEIFRGLRAIAIFVVVRRSLCGFADWSVGSFVFCHFVIQQRIDP